MRTYTSPVPQWPGTIQTADYLTYPELIDWDEALTAAKAHTDPEGGSVVKFYHCLLPLAIRLVGKWEIAGLPAELGLATFPGSPALAAWLVDCISDLFRTTNGLADPNSPAPSSSA